MTASSSICRLALFLFVAASLASLQVSADPTPQSDANIHLRGSFQNARIRFEQEKKGNVAFIGGSITEMDGYRPMVMEILKRRFPKTEFAFTAAGISSTCSTTGAFRLADHVLNKGPVDLFFIEFAVNDDQDAVHARRECIRGLEGVVRHTRLHSPNADIVVTYFVNPSMLATWQAGKVPLSIAAHDEVAKHYKIPTINLAKEVAEQITEGNLTWQQFGGTHPKPYGNQIFAAMIDRLMDLAWHDPLAADAKPTLHLLPEKPLDAQSYYRGRLVDAAEARLSKAFTYKVPNWSALKGACRSRFSKDRLFCAEDSGAELTLDFEGTAIGAYVLAGPDAGIVEASIDGQPSKKVNLYHRFSKGLHYPRTVMFATDLKPGQHTLKLRTTDEKHPSSVGNAIRVLHFVAN